MVGLGYYRVSKNGNPLVNLLPFLLCSLALLALPFWPGSLQIKSNICRFDKMGVNSSGWICYDKSKSKNGNPLVDLLPFLLCSLA